MTKIALKMILLEHLNKELERFKGSGNYQNFDKTRVKLFPNFTRHHFISIGNRTISSTIWKLIDTSNVLKVLVIARADRRVQFKNFQNITSVY